jgi:hypothetical protein
MTYVCFIKQRSKQMTKHTQEELDLIAAHYNFFVVQDGDGNVVGNTNPKAETGWRPIYRPDCDEAIALGRSQ